MPADFVSLCRGLAAADRQRLRRVWRYAQEHLSDLTRRTGESYSQHCLEVAHALREASQDATLIAVALLHDLLVSEHGGRWLRQAPLNAEERGLVEHMHRLRRLHIDESTQDLDTFLQAFAVDARLLPLRMAHRVNDVRHLGRFSPELKRRIAHETLHMYGAVAGRLGMHNWRYELEDLSFVTLHPKIAKNLQRKFDAVRELDMACLKHTRAFLRSRLRRQDIRPGMSYRIKSLYSTYHKMILKRRTFEELTDRLALRITVQEVQDCYRVLGVVHTFMHPIPGKLKDYIGAPKENGYQSLHTVVYPLPGVTEEPIEVQIRTEEMDAACQYGPLSHAEYKTALYSLQKGSARVGLFKNLATLREETRSPKQFETALRKYFREDQIAIFDDEGNLYHLPKPATVLDYACHVFPERYRRIRTVYINGRKSILSLKLSDGDTVALQFGRSAIVRLEWIHACFQKHTKQRIRAFVEKQKKLAGRKS